MADQIRPGWEEKLAAVKAAVERRGRRQIIMRQVGGRLVPVGVTSGRIHTIEDPGENEEDSSSGRRSRRRPPQSAELGHLLQSMGIGMGGQDLEEVSLAICKPSGLLMLDLDAAPRGDATIVD